MGVGRMSAPSSTSGPDDAFAAYAAIAMLHAADPDNFDNPDREAERRAAHDRFMTAFEADNG